MNYRVSYSSKWICVLKKSPYLYFCHQETLVHIPPISAWIKVSLTWSDAVNFKSVCFPKRCSHYWSAFALMRSFTWTTSKPKVPVFSLSWVKTLVAWSSEMGLTTGTRLTCWMWTKQLTNDVTITTFEWQDSPLPHKHHHIMEKESHSSQKHEKNTSTHVFTPTNINSHLSTHIHLLTRMLRYTHELTYADSKELFSKRQEILEVTEMYFFLFLFRSLHDACFCMHELYSALLFEFTVIKVTGIKSNKFVAFRLVADGRVFEHPVYFSHVSFNHTRSLGNLCILES